MKKTMLALVLTAATASAEFTVEEKEVASQVAQFSVHAANIAFYVADEARTTGDAANHALYSQTLSSCLSMGREAWQAAGWIVGSVGINGNTPDTNDPNVRLERTRHFFSRVHPSGSAACFAGVDAMIGAGASTWGLTVAVDERIIPHMEFWHPVWMAELDAAWDPATETATGFLLPDPPEWPFFVRRPPGGIVGLHGEFELAMQEIGRGIGYFHDSAVRTAEAWRDQPYVDGSDGDIRSFMLGFRDGMRKFHQIQMMHHHFVPCDKQANACPATDSSLPWDKQYAPEQNEFERLDIVLEIVESEIAADFRSMQQFYMVPLLDKGYSLGPAVSRHADGWFHGVDLYAWETTRFPCIAGYPSRCQEDLDGTGPAPTPTPTPPPPVFVCNPVDVEVGIMVDGVLTGTTSLPAGNCP